MLKIKIKVILFPICILILNLCLSVNSSFTASLDSGKVYETNDFRWVNNLVEQLALKYSSKDSSDQERNRVLFVFDLDETLVTPCDSCLHFANWETFYKKFKIDRLLYGNTTPVSELIDEITLQMQFKLTDEFVPRVINKIKKYNFKSIILTSCPHGRLVGVDKQSLEDLRIQKLNRALQSVSGFEKLNYGPFFHECRSLNERFNGVNSGPLFKSDILFCAGRKKEQVFYDFLMHMQTCQYIPKVIVFVDNMQENVFRVISAVTYCNTPIEVYGIVYTKWNTSYCGVEMMNEKIQPFLNTSKWV